MLSKRWSRLLQRPDTAWAAVTIATDGEFPEEVAPDAAAMAACFGRRAGSVQGLRVIGSQPKMTGSLLATVTATQYASLRTLELDLEAASISGPDLAVLAGATFLQTLTIHLPMGTRVPCWVDHAASLIATVSRLPALRRLELDAFQSTADEMQPTVSQLAALCSPSLSHLDTAMTSTPDGIFILSGLPALTSCATMWTPFEGHVLHLTPFSFSEATGLTKLTFTDHRQLQLTPHCFDSLSMLVYLSLDNCGLTAVPAALSGVQDTLKTLDLRRNAELQIGQAGFETLLALPALEQIDLRKSLEPENISQWTVQSSCFLVRFLSEWQDRQPGAPRPAFWA